MNITKWISVFERCYLQYKNEEFKELGICGCQGVYFFFLSKNPGVTQEKIAESIFVNKSSVTRNLQDLEQKKLIRREIDKIDKRINRIYLTDEGEFIAMKIREKINKYNEIIKEDFTNEELEILNNLLYKLVLNASKQAKKSFLSE